MKAPLIVVIASGVEILAPLAYLARRNQSRPVLWIVCGALASVVGNVFGRFAAHATGNNHWVSYIDLALMFSFYLIGLAEWQVTSLERTWLRRAILPLLGAYILLTLEVEDLHTFSRFAYPMYSVVLLGVASWTMLRRAFLPVSPPLQETDWFWVAGGLGFYGATTLITSPIGRILMEQHRYELFSSMYEVRSACAIVAFLAIGYGFLRPPTTLVPAE